MNHMWNPECLEWNIWHTDFEDSEAEAKITETVAAIRKDPRKSVIATMGLEQIRTGITANIVHGTRWSNTETVYVKKAEEFYQKKMELQPALNTIYQKAKEASKDLYNLQLRMTTYQDSCNNFESHSKKYEHRVKIANIVKEVMKKFTAESEDIIVSICVYCQLFDKQLSATHKCICLCCFLLSSLTKRRLHLQACRRFWA